jgi:hypothetical protein
MTNNHSLTALQIRIYLLYFVTNYRQYVLFRNLLINISD